MASIVQDIIAAVYRDKRLPLYSKVQLKLWGGCRPRKMKTLLLTLFLFGTLLCGSCQAGRKYHDCDRKGLTVGLPGTAQAKTVAALYFKNGG